MKSVWERHAWTDLPTARKIYLDSVSRAGFGQDDSGGGSMKPLGLREPLNEDIELDLLSQHFNFEKEAGFVNPKDIYGISARIIYSDLGNVAAYHFVSKNYGIIIVINPKFNTDIQEEGRFHEAREIYWMGKDFSQHEAHVIASAEQAQKFLIGNGITSYHGQQLRSMGSDELDAMITENEETRQWHYSVLNRAIALGANIDILAVQDYERRLREYARELLDARIDTDETVMGDSTAKVARDEAARRDSGELLSPQDQIPPEDSISTTPRQMGGIDFRNLPIVTQAVGNLRANIGSSPVNRFNSINLNSEWREIENLVNSGITPSAERIKEYVQASCYKGSIDRNIDKVISCISDILRIEEERYSPTDPTLKDILVVLDSANSVQQLKAVLIGSTP
jgi:hypothetical protein